MENVPAILAKCGLEAAEPTQAEQIHGHDVATALREHRGKTLPGVDALITAELEHAIVIRVADCGPIYLYDPVHRAIGLAHSGKKGTEANIFAATVQAMTLAFGTRASDLIAVLGPCIRPPYYEIDIPAAIARQARELGIGGYHDCGLNTGLDLRRFYSYRMEKGQTERHFAALMLTPR